MGWYGSTEAAHETPPVRVDYVLVCVSPCMMLMLLRRMSDIYAELERGERSGLKKVVRTELGVRRHCTAF